MIFYKKKKLKMIDDTHIITSNSLKVASLKVIFFSILLTMFKLLKLYLFSGFRKNHTQHNNNYN